MAESACPDCGGKIGIKATRCRCGWKMPGTPQRNDRPIQPAIQCCFQGCAEASICRIFTKTGWANVCRTHYPQVKESPKGYGYDSPTVVEARKAYERSPLYRRLKGGEAVPGTIGAIVPRQPGEDAEEPALGIKVDDLEREFADRSNP